MSGDHAIVISEWIRDGRCIVEGGTYSVSTLAKFAAIKRPGAGRGIKRGPSRRLVEIEIDAECIRCGRHWRVVLDLDDVRDTYDVVPTTPSASRLFASVPTSRNVFRNAIRHTCAPRGTPQLSESAWLRVDEGATEPERADALMQALAEWLRDRGMK